MNNYTFIFLQLLTQGAAIPQGVNLTAPISPSNLALLTGTRLPLRVSTSTSSSSVSCRTTSLSSSQAAASYMDDNYELMAPILQQHRQHQPQQSNTGGNSVENSGTNSLIDEDRYFQCEPMESGEDESPMALTTENPSVQNKK